MSNNAGTCSFPIVSEIHYQHKHNFFKLASKASNDFFGRTKGSWYALTAIKKSPKQTDRGGKRAKNTGNEFFKTRFKNAIITPARDKRNESQKCLNSERPANKSQVEISDF